MTRNLRMIAVNQPRQDAARAVHAASADTPLSLPSASRTADMIARIEARIDYHRARGQRQLAKRAERELQGALRFSRLIVDVTCGAVQ